MCKDTPRARYNCGLHPTSGGEEMSARQSVQDSSAVDNGATVAKSTKMDLQLKPLIVNGPMSCLHETSEVDPNNNPVSSPCTVLGTSEFCSSTSDGSESSSPSVDGEYEWHLLTLDFAKDIDIGFDSAANKEVLSFVEDQGLGLKRRAGAEAREAGKAKKPKTQNPLPAVGQPMGGRMPALPFNGMVWGLPAPRPQHPPPPYPGPPHAWPPTSPGMFPPGCMPAAPWMWGPHMAPHAFGGHPLQQYQMAGHASVAGPTGTADPALLQPIHFDDVYEDLLRKANHWSLCCSQPKDVQPDLSEQAPNPIGLTLQISAALKDEISEITGRRST